MHITEIYGETKNKNTYLLDSNSNHKIKKTNFTKLQTIIYLITSVFLPHGFPSSVSEDYLDYQKWDTIQAFCSTITNTLATRSILKGMGVGSLEASLSSATVTWLFKDGAGMIGQVLFAWLKSSDLDSDCKKWRLIADILNDSSMLIDLISPFFPSYFFFLICFSGLLRSIVGVAGGATRAAITQHQALGNNMADVAAKDNSQETLVNLFGVFSGATFVSMVTDNITIWIVFLTLTYFHLYSNYKAVKSLKFNSLNRKRLKIIINNYFNYKKIIHFNQANQFEPLLFDEKENMKIILGSSLQNILKHSHYNNNNEIINEEKLNKNYLISIDFKKSKIFVTLTTNATSLDTLKSCIQAEIINYSITHNPKICEEQFASLKCSIKYGHMNEVIETSRRILNDNFDFIIKSLQQNGWIFNPLYLKVDQWRVEI